MSDKSASDKGITENIISWIFVVIFFTLGILNLIFVHYVPGILYILLSLVYLPSINAFLNKRLGFSIPLWAKIFVGIIIIWGTLGVGDLMELFEAWMVA